MVVPLGVIKQGTATGGSNPSTFEVLHERVHVRGYQGLHESPGTVDVVHRKVGESTEDLEEFPGRRGQDTVLRNKVCPLESSPHRLLEVELAAADCGRGPHRQDSVVKSDLVVAEDTLWLVGSKGVQLFKKVGVQDLSFPRKESERQRHVPGGR